MKRSVVALMLIAVLLLSFNFVYAAEDDVDDIPSGSAFSKFLNWFKGLFGPGYEDGRYNEDELPDSYGGMNNSGVQYNESGELDNYPYSYSEFEGGVELIFNGSTKAGINEPATYIGSAIGANECSVNGVPLGSCNPFVYTLNFSIAGTYPIIFVADGETVTVMLVVEEGFVANDYNETFEANDTIKITFHAPETAVVGVPAMFIGSVIGADSCTLDGVALSDCSSFAKSLTFDSEGTYSVVLAAGGGSEIRVVEVFADEADASDDPKILEDINKVPVDDGTLDANGWPAYLNVPDYCPGPEVGKSHKYYWPLYGQGPNQPWGPDLKMVRDYGRFSSTWLWTGMSVSEVYAMPFYAGNYEDWWFGVVASYDQAPIETSYSECPGDFERMDGNPDKGCVLGGRGSSVHSASTELVDEINPDPNTPARNGRADRLCTLEPGKRYFLNARMQVVRDSNGVITSGCTGFCNTQTTYGVNKVSSEKYPPYTGPCLDNPPYPANYYVSQCTGHSFRSSWEDGRCSTGLAEESTKTWTCTDGEGGSVIGEYIHTCQNGEWITTKGKDTPATPNMVCSFGITPSSSENFGGCIKFLDDKVYTVGTTFTKSSGAVVTCNSNNMWEDDEGHTEYQAGGGGYI